MRRVRSANTSPERKVRSLLHGMGFRFRLHDGRLPGKPDLVLPKHRTVVFVHGCFWHRHPGCRRASTPAENQEYWLPKFRRTVSRDRRILAELRGRGWNVVTVWECELKQRQQLAKRLFSEITRAAAEVVNPDLLAAEQQARYNTTAQQKKAKTASRRVRRSSARAH
jgi:DNA mismatch endonuclease (patch repair protein)